MSAAEAQHTRGLEELRAQDADRFGGKSASLGELLHAGIPVPPGLCHQHRGGGGAHRHRCAAISRRDMGAWGPRCPWPSAQRPWARTAPRPPSPASRTPTSGCAASTRSATPSPSAGPASTAPRRSPTGSASASRIPPWGSTIQLMVDAAVSGVMFTCNPVSGDRSMVAINASWGLGLAVVGGEVTPDDYLVSKVTGEIVKQTVNDKAVEYVPADDGARARRCRRGRAATSRASTPTPSTTLVDIGQARRDATSAPPRTSSGRSTTTASCSSSNPARSPAWPRRRRDARTHVRDVHDLQQVRSHRLMPLNDDDVREILRIIDESDLDELRIETDGFTSTSAKALRRWGCALSGVVRRSTSRERARQPRLGVTTQPPRARRRYGLDTIASPMLGTFYRAEAPGAAPFVEVGARSGPRRPCASSRS